MCCTAQSPGQSTSSTRTSHRQQRNLGSACVRLSPGVARHRRSGRHGHPQTKCGEGQPTTFHFPWSGHGRSQSCAGNAARSDSRSATRCVERRAIALLPAPCGRVKSSSSSVVLAGRTSAASIGERHRSVAQLHPAARTGLRTREARRDVGHIADVSAGHGAAWARTMSCPLRVTAPFNPARMAAAFSSVAMRLSRVHSMGTRRPAPLSPQYELKGRQAGAGTSSGTCHRCGNRVPSFRDR